MNKPADGFPAGARILFVIGTLDLGGAELHLKLIAPRLKRLGWKPAIYCLGRRGAQADEIQAAGVDVIGPPLPMAPIWRFILFRPVRLAASALGLLSQLMGRRPQIVHFFLPASYVVGAPMALLARTPTRVMSRRSLNLYQRKWPLVARLERWLHQRMSAILGNSGRVVRELIEVEGCSPDRVGLIYNGIDATAFTGQPDKADLRDQLGIDPESFVAIIVANLIPYKGHADLFDALSRIRDRLPQHWTLLCVGRDDGIRGDLQDIANATGISDQVRFLGERRDVPRLLAAADIGVLCSHQEGFSNAILECMAAALPMVVTDVGGNGEAVLDGETGFVVPPRDPDALGKAILKLASEPALRAEQGKKARARVEAQFSIQACVSNYDRLYTALLAGEAVSDLDGIRAADYGFRSPTCAESAASSTP